MDGPGLTSYLAGVAGAEVVPLVLPLQAAQLVRECMESAAELRGVCMRVRVSKGPSWGELEEIQGLG